MDQSEKSQLTRRDFLKLTATAGAGAFFFAVLPLKGCRQPSTVAPPPDGLSGRVVHVRNPAATTWDFGPDYYGSHVDQAVVDDMVRQGVQALTGTSSSLDAWRQLLPDYSLGNAIAIKVNFNNCGGCATTGNAIDALIQPVNAIVAGLKQRGVAESDIWVYDASRGMSSRFINACAFAGVRFIGKWTTTCTVGTTFTSLDPDAVVSFAPPAGTPLPAAQRIADVLVDASYLINVPILKTHAAGVTLGFKNHFGSISSCADLHEYILPGGSLYSSQYSPLVDIYANPHIRGKTILTVADGLFGNWQDNYSEPRSWATFGNAAPSSLFLGRDPVALDCVMTDFLSAERRAQLGSELPDSADDYLQLAGSRGLGMYERGDPLRTPYGIGYSSVHYVRLDI